MSIFIAVGVSPSLLQHCLEISVPCALKLLRTTYDWVHVFLIMLLLLEINPLRIVATVQCSLSDFITFSWNAGSLALYRTRIKV